MYTYIHTFIYIHMYKFMEKYLEGCELLSLVMNSGCVLYKVGQEKGGRGWISFSHL